MESNLAIRYRNKIGNICPDCQIPRAICAPVYYACRCPCALRAVAPVYLCNKIPRKSQFLRAFFVYIILKVFLPQCIIPA